MDPAIEMEVSGEDDHEAPLFVTTTIFLGVLAICFWRLSVIFKPFDYLGVNCPFAIRNAHWIVLTVTFPLWLFGSRSRGGIVLVFFLTLFTTVGTEIWSQKQTVSIHVTRRLTSAERHDCEARLGFKVCQAKIDDIDPRLWVTSTEGHIEALIEEAKRLKVYRTNVIDEEPDNDAD